MYHSFIALLVVLCSVQVLGQPSFDAGPHARQERLRPGAQPNGSYFPAGTLQRSEGRVLTHKVMGYHPYWRSDENIEHYRFDLLSHVVYFSVGVDPNTGAITTTRDWLTTPLVEAAHSAGCRVHLCVTNFGSGNNLNLLQNPAARDTLIAQLIRLVQRRGGDGINLDFESMPAAARDDLVIFCRDLDTRLEAAIPGAEISSAMPAVDWSDAWDVAELAKHIDLFFLMCYDYYWSGSSNAGPVAPIQGSSYNVTRTVDWYLGQGVPKDQLLIGVPYYGIDWPVVSDQANAATEEKGTAYIYTSAMNGVNLHGRLWSGKFLNPWYKYETASYWHQTWYDDTESLGHKYDLTLDREIAGIGMWALSYDNGRDELWELIEEKFTAPVSIDPVNMPGTFSLGPAWPNPAGPATGTVHFAYSHFHGVLPTHVKVFDALGRLVYETEISGADQSGILSVPVQSLSAGMYRVAVENTGILAHQLVLIVR